MEQYRRTNILRAGFTTMEAALALTLLAIFTTSVIGAVLFGADGSITSGARVRAVMYAQEGLEAARNIRDGSWSYISDGVFGIATSSGQWIFSGTSDTQSIYTRSIQFGRIDNRRKYATTTVAWSQNLQRAATTTLVSYFTNWDKSMGNWASITNSSTINPPGTVAGRKVAIYTASSTGNKYAIMVRATNASGYELDVVDITSVITPVGGLELGTVSVTGVKILGDNAIITTNAATGQLKVVSLVNPATPTVIGTYTAARNLQSLDVYGTSTVCVGTIAGANNFLVLSLANPTAPVLLGSATLSGSTIVNDISINRNGTYAAVALASNNPEFASVNIQNPAAMTSATVNVTSNSFGTAVATFGDYAYLGRANGSTYVINMTNPAAPSQGVAGSTYTGGITDVESGMGGLYMFVTATNATKPFVVVNVSNPAALVELGFRVFLNGGTGNGVAWDFDLDRCYLSTTNGNAEFAQMSPN